MLDEWQARDHLPVRGGVTPRGKVDTLVRPTSLNRRHTIEFLLHLGRLAGNRLLVAWDGSPIHRRAEVTEFVAETMGAVVVERRPSYAPDLNPEAFTLRRGQILLQSAEGHRPKVIAAAVGCCVQSVRNALRAFEAEGLACLAEKSSRPKVIHDAFDDGGRQRLRDLGFNPNGMSLIPTHSCAESCRD